MADLTKFVNPALKQGENLDVYLNRFPKIGTGKANVLQTLHANFYVDVSVLGQSIKGDIDIVMPDTSPSGTCKVGFLGSPRQATYETHGNKLAIQLDGRTVTLYGGDKAWSWIDVSGVPGSIGIWPASKALHDDAEADLAGVDA